MPIGWLEILLIVIVGLAIFGPKTLQSLAQSAGRSAGQASQMKDKLVDDLSIDDLKKLADMPRNPQQVLQRLITADDKDEKDKKKAAAKTEGSTTEKGADRPVETKPE